RQAIEVKFLCQDRAENAREKDVEQIEERANTRNERGNAMRAGWRKTVQPGGDGDAGWQGTRLKAQRSMPNVRQADISFFVAKAQSLEPKAWSLVSYFAADASGLPFWITKAATALTGVLPVFLPSWMRPGSTEKDCPALNVAVGLPSWS